MKVNESDIGVLAKDAEWDGICRRALDIVEIKSIDAETRSVRVIASTETLDAHGDVVKQFWNLKRAKKNCPVLWNHNSGGYLSASAEETFPIGKAKELTVEGHLEATLYFGSKEYSELAEKAFLGFKEEILKGVSIGFRPGSVKRVVKGDRYYYEIGDEDNPNELLEISVVPIGSNPDAVAKSIELERKHLGRSAANKPAESGKVTHMDPELQKAIEAKALADKALETEKSLRAEAEKRVSDLEAKAKSLETELANEKTVSTKLTAELAASAKALADSQDLVIASEVEKLVGVKITPAEQAEHVALAKQLGIERVKALVANRPDLKLTQPVEVEGEKVSKSDPNPPAVELDASADISNKALKAAN